MTTKLHGLVAATHTPFDADGQLNLTTVAKQGEYLHRAGVNAVSFAEVRARAIPSRPGTARPR